MIDIDGSEVLFTITCVSDTSMKYLHIICSKLKPYFAFSSSDEVRQFIKDNYKQIYDEAFAMVFGRLDNSNYYLNIAPDENYGNFPWNKSTGRLVIQQIETYKPLIQLFIQDTKTYPHNSQQK